MPLAWSYLRTSSIRQAQADRSGVERQEQALARWLSEHPEYQLAEALVDAGVSAGKGRHRKRGALSRFIEGGRTGVVPPGSALVVESMSRFSREVATDVLGTLLELWNLRLAISFTTDGAILDKSLIDREDHRLHGLVGAIGQARREWEERSRRSSGAAAKARRAQDEGARTAGPTPWWIARDPITGHLLRDAAGGLQLDPVAAATIGRAARLAIEGLGCSHVADRLNAEGCPAPWRRSRGRQPGDRWSFSQVSNLLRHPAIAGVLVRKDGQQVAGYYPAVLTAEEFRQLRASMEDRHRAKGRLRNPSPLVRNLFQGLSRCAICGDPFTFHPPSARARRDHPGWVGCRSRNARQSSRCGNKGLIEYGGFESHLLTRLAMTDWEALLRRPEDDADRHQLEHDADRARAERDQLQAQFTNAQKRAQAAWRDGATDERLSTIEGAVADLRTQLAAAESRHADAEQRLAVIRSRPSASGAAAELAARVRSFWDALPVASPAERLAFNRWLLGLQVEFRVGAKPASGGDRLIWLLVDGRRVSYAPLAGPARQWAREEGVVDPALAIAEQLPDGRTAMVLIERTPGPPPPPRGRVELIDGGHILVLNPPCPAADAEPPDEWPWSALLVPGLGSEGGAASPSSLIIGS